MVGAASQDFADAHEVRFLVHDDAGVRRDRHFAVGERVQRVDRPVGRLVVADVNYDLDLVGRIVVDLLDFDLAFVVRADDRILDRLGGRAERNFGDRQRPFVDLVDPGAHFDRSAAQSVVIARYVGQPPGRKIRVNFEVAAPEVGDARVDQFVEVMWQDFRCQSDRDALDSLGQQQREFDRQRYRFLIPPVVRQHPFGDFRVEHHVQREFRQPRLDVTRGGGSVAGQHVAPVSLAVDQQVFLPELHQRVTDRGVAVRVVLHRRPDDVRHFVVPAVVQFLHRVQDAPLHRLQPVFDMRHGAFEDHVRCVIQKPVLVHAGQFAPVGFVVGQTSVFSGAGVISSVRFRAGREVVPAVVDILFFVHVWCCVPCLKIVRIAFKSGCPRNRPRSAGCR